MFRAIFALCAVTAFAADPPMTNADVLKMLQSGVSKGAILAAISACEPHFGLTPSEMNGLARAGVPDDVIRAMAARLNQETQRPPVRTSGPVQPQPIVPERAPKPPRIPRERPDDWGLLPGQPELGALAGTSYLVSDFDLGRNVPDIRLGAFAFDGAVGINRYAAVIGTLAHHTRGGASGCLNRDCGEIRASLGEFLAGVKVSLSNRSHVTPFVLGQGGALRATASADGIDTTVRIGRRSYDLNNASLSAWTPAGVVGGGIDVHATRNIGFRAETRFLRTIDVGWFGRTSGGVFYRFGR